MFRVKLVSKETLTPYFYVVIGQILVKDIVFYTNPHSYPQIMQNAENKGLSDVRVERIELSPHPWQGRVLPLNDTRNGIILHWNRENSNWKKLIVLPEGFEPPTTVPKTGMISISLRELWAYHT